MTRRDFEAIAAALRTARIAPRFESFNRGVDAAIIALAVRISQEQPGFDQGRFLTNAGYQS